jgi:acyl-CoA thioesterase
METSGPDAQAIAQRSAEAMYAADDASQRLGIAITDVAPGRATARMRITADMVNGHGIAHGGYVFLLADTAFAFACNTYGGRVVARGASIVFVAAAREGDELVATGVERLRYGRNGIYDITVRRTGWDEVVAEFRGESHRLSTDSDTGAR